MGHKVVHIDDDPDIRMVISAILTKEGYEVASFEESTHALESMGDPPPDMVILDVMMEDVDSGLQSYNSIREQYPQVPVMFLTSLGEQVRPFFDNLPNVSDAWIMEKPVDAERLLSGIRSRIGS